jgi:hypothetical protein
MLRSPQELHSNLARLREQISSLVCCAPCSEHESIARGAAKRMPLSHTTRESLFRKVIECGALLSSDQRGAVPRSVDAELGGSNEICFYLGSAAFPNNEFGLLFSNHFADAFEALNTASATPFDSGGCVSRYTLPPDTEPIAHVRAHKMPVPECREYLGDLLATYFEVPAAYLAGRPFTCPGCLKPLADPHGMPDYEDGLVRMHEVRIPTRVDLEFPSLIAIFAPQGNIQPYLAPLIASGVDLIPYDDQNGSNRYRALRRASVDYILEKFLN